MTRSGPPNWGLYSGYPEQERSSSPSRLTAWCLYLEEAVDLEGAATFIIDARFK